MTHVLLVEDEPSIADTLIYALETERFRVTHTLTGKDALKTISANNIDFCILDIGLPDITGFEVCREIRRRSATPVLFLTARDGEIDRILGLELGGDDYVTKPFSPREVVARVKAIMRRGTLTNLKNSAEPKKSKTSPVTPWHHDHSAMKIFCYGKALTLTAHEYKLLIVFLENRGRVMNREQLLDKAWQDPLSVSDRTVDAHIKSLRAKIKAIKDGAEEKIQTRRGLGYVMEE